MRLRFCPEPPARNGDRSLTSTSNPSLGDERLSIADDILIVDDEADIRELVSGILQDEGYITRSARDSDDALAHVASRRPNLVYLDICCKAAGSTALHCSTR